MASIITRTGIAIILMGICECSYKNIPQQYELGSSANVTKAGSPTFTRSDFQDGLDCIYPTDCKDVQNCGRIKTGVYRVFPFGVGEGFLVSCDMTSAGGGWLVIQRRLDGSVDFYRNWHNYSDGFGNLAGEFWLGLDKIHVLTSQRPYELLVNMGSYDNGTVSARFGRFFVSGEKDNYRLLVHTYTGTAGDSLAYHNGFEFSTFDRENDHHKTANCAADFHGAWWYKSCHYSHLNGKYFFAESRAAKDSKAMSWYHWTGYYKPLQSAEMKIRPHG